jgi:hypothetical protein
MLKQILCGLSLLGAASFANAAIIYTTLQNNSVVNVATDWSGLAAQTLTLNQFDDLGGTRSLVSVQLTFSGDISSSGTITNNAITSNTLTQFDISSAFSLKFLDDTNANWFTAVANLIEPATDDDPAGDPITINAGETLSIDIGDLVGSNFRDRTLTSGSAGFDKFEGTGVLDFKATTLTTTLAGTTGGNFDQTISTIGGAVVGVIYGYEMAVVAIPEPRALAIIGLALAGMGFSVRRRKSAI